MLQAKQSKETSSLQYYFVPVRRDKSWHLDRTNRFCCKQKHMSFLLRSQLHILSYSILDKKHMVLFCCLKNMKICAVITNICVHSKLFQESQTLLDMLKYQWELIVLKGKKKPEVVEPPAKQKLDPTGLWSTFPREIPRTERGCVFVTGGQCGEDKEHLWKLCNVCCWVRSCLC